MVKGRYIEKKVLTSWPGHSLRCDPSHPLLHRTAVARRGRDRSNTSSGSSQADTGGCSAAC